MSRAALLWLVLVGGCALAAGCTRPPSRAQAALQPYMARFDRDGDGRISRAEWSGYGGADDTFTAWDFNADGYLELDEFEAFFRGAVRPRQPWER